MPIKSINRNEINIPINSEKRDPFYGRNKSEIGLGLVQNMSYSSIESSILANVKNFINEGVTYKYESYASDSSPILANLVKLKPNSSFVSIHFSLGTWTENSEFIPRDTATLELKSNKNNVSYNLYISESYNNSGFESTDSNINKSTPLSSTKVIIKEFTTGGWLVTLRVIDTLIDAIWVNFSDYRNIDVQNPGEAIYDESNFGRSVEFYCDKSRISTNLDIGGTSLIAKSLSHDVPIKIKSVDPNDFYNNNSNTHSLTNIDIGPIVGTSDIVKDDTLISIPISTDEDVCKTDQMIPMSVNRLNHLIKFRLSGAVNELQASSWKDSQTDQSNLKSFLDTDPEVINEYPISIKELSHDIDLKVGKGQYFGSKPESGDTGGSGYGSYEFDGDSVNYASIFGSSTGRNEYYLYNTSSKSWILSSSNLGTNDKSLSLSTKPGINNEMNLIIHGLDHDIKIEVANLSYRNSRGSATDENGLLSSNKVVNSGIRNLTWESYDGIPDEKRRNSYATGSIKLNTFEKDYYQCLDLSIHGLDHNINLEFYRIESDVLSGPSDSEKLSSDTYRPNSDGKDILGSLSIDTFSSRVQKFNLQVIDGRYSDCTRGLALMHGDNYMPYDVVDDLGKYGDYLPTDPSSDEIENIFPTINGIPFTGDFRYKIKYPSNLERDGISKEHSARNIIIPAYHLNSSLDGSGYHDWEVLKNLRVLSYSDSETPVSKLSDVNYSNSEGEVENGYGLVKLTTISPIITEGSYKDKMNAYLGSLSSDEDVITVKAFKRIISESVENSSEGDEGIDSVINLVEDTKNELLGEIEKSRTSSLHADSSLSKSGPHKWEVLSSIRVAKISDSGQPISMILNENYLDENSSIDNGYGLVKLTTSDSSVASQDLSPIEKLNKLESSLSSDDSDVITVGALKSFIKVIRDRFEKIENSHELNKL